MTSLCPPSYIIQYLCSRGIRRESALAANAAAGFSQLHVWVQQLVGQSWSVVVSSRWNTYLGYLGPLAPGLFVFTYDSDVWTHVKGGYRASSKSYNSVFMSEKVPSLVLGTYNTNVLRN